MIRWLWVFVLMANVAAAQGIPVRSGEHDGFTRLVFDVPKGADWRAEQDTADGIIVTFPDQSQGFDTSAVFERIARARVANLRQTAPDRLIVALACECGFTAYALRDRMVVLDITDPDPETAVRRPPNLPSLPKAADGGPDIGRSFVRLSGLPEKLDARLNSDDQETFNSFRDMLANDLTAAAANGILRAGISEVTGGSDVVATNDLSVADTEAEPRHARVILGTDEAKDEPRLTLRADACPVKGAMQIREWSDGQDLAKTLSKGYAQLFEEFDRLNPQNQTSFAKALIYHGFGAEARSVLRLGDHTADPVLMALTYAVDAQPDPTGILQGMAECDGPIAMWAMLGTDAGDLSANLDSDLLLRSFEALPKHLKSYLGAVLAQNLLDLGQVDVARAILRRAGRGAEDADPKHVLVSARADIAEGRKADAIEQLAPLGLSSTPVAASAAAEAVELAHDTGAELDPALGEVVSAFAEERRHAEDGDQLWRAEILAFLGAGAFQHAFDALDAAQGIDASLVERTTKDVWDRLAKDADTALFLQQALSRQREEIAQLDQASVFAISERLVDQGFPEAALFWLAAKPVASQSEQGRLLRAQAFLTLGRPEDAELLIIGLRSDRAMFLRARARAAMNDHAYAARVFGDLGDADLAGTSAWLSGAPVADADRTALPVDTAVLDAFSSLAPLETDAPPSLEGAQTLFQQSQKSRQAVTDLLQQTSVPPG